MKKKVLFVAALFVGATTFAQDGLTSKKGEAFLPEAGDYALGFDGTPFINFVGNMANGASGNSLTLNNQWNTIYGKMFKDETTAYRGMVRIGMSSSSSTSAPIDANTDSSYTNTNKTSSGFAFIVGGGLEKRRGSGRLQGVYGGQAMFGMIPAANTSTEYGKALSDANQNGGATRTLETNNGNTLTFGLEGFAGVEYFILPKFSLGAEVTWGLGFSSTGESDAVTEKWGLTAAEAASATPPSAHNVSETSITSGSSSAFSLDNSAGANFKVMFHF